MLLRFLMVYRSSPELRARVWSTLRLVTPDIGTGEVEAPSELPHVVPVNFRIADSKVDYLNVMVPGMVLRAMSGGPNTALNLTYRLAREGVPVRYVSTDVAPETETDRLWEHMGQLTGIENKPKLVDVVNGRHPDNPAPLGKRDLFLATAWWTAQMVRAAQRQTGPRRFLYFIQDFEAPFYPWSSLHATALETYSFDFNAIVNEAVLREYLVENRVGNFGEPGFFDRTVSFEPALDTSHFYPEIKTSPTKRLLFYARPNAPRNLYELGVLALKGAAESGAFDHDDWELLGIGENIPPTRLTGNHILRPIEWLDYASYAQLLRTSHVGLALMLSPHTGYPCLEMAACGMRVVTNSFANKTQEKFAAISPNITAVAPRVGSLTDAISVAALANTQPISPQRSHFLPTSWDEVFEPMVPRVIHWLEEIWSHE